MRAKVLIFSHFAALISLKKPLNQQEVSDVLIFDVLKGDTLLPTLADFLVDGERVMQRCKEF